MLKRSAIAVSIAIAVTGSGCGQPPSGDRATETEPTVTVRDSAGIEIVENHAPEHTTGEFWTIDPEPEFVLGGSENPSGLANDSSQLVWDVVGLARLPDGRVAILSSENKRLMLFEPSGELSMTIGGPGEGPGEFIHPEQLQYPPPDTLVVWDYFLTAIDYFDSSGNLLRERSVDYSKLREHDAWGESRRIPLPDGSFLVGVMDKVPDDSPDDCTHLTITRESFRGGESKLHAEELLKIDDSYTARSFGCASSFFSLMTAGGDPPYFYIHNAGNEVQQRALDGSLVRIIRRSTEPPPVTDKARLAEREHWMRYGAGMAELVVRVEETRAVEAPIWRREKYDAVESMLVDTEGYLWIREWSASESGIPDQWSVFSPTGRWQGVLAFPPEPIGSDLRICSRRTTACWIGKDYFLVVRRDEMGVERVEGYRIRRGG
ncbi:MAG: hypothetical protein OXI76_11045 [Gemmatimonadota bacterium]|nr:hypothetical protein [Gemmatimonadota bacterium]